MKKILALILALCMCIAVLVACDNKDTEVVTETKAETTEKETEADTKKPSSTDDDEEEDDEDEGGEEGDGTTPDAAEISIGSVAEWEALATAGDPDKEDFLNKTVKLTANIDFGTATATTLFKTFAGTFDGGNFTIKGKTASRMSLLANTLDGATVKNVTVDGFAISCPVEGAENTSVIAANAMTSNTTAENPTVTFENITIKNCSEAFNFVSNTTYEVEVGFVSLFNGNTVYVFVKVDGTLTAWELVECYGKTPGNIVIATNSAKDSFVVA